MISLHIQSMLNVTASRLFADRKHHSVVQVARLAGVKHAVAMIYFANSNTHELYHHAECGSDICVKQL